MQIERKESNFRPVVITIEAASELNDFKELAQVGYRHTRGGSSEEALASLLKRSL